ncbi:MAG: SIMPL domain-containing protein [Acidimicrobiales bacterium]
MTILRVGGTGTAPAVPDHASLNFQVRADEPTAAAALSKATERAGQVVELLHDAGIEKQDRGAQHTSVHRRTRWDGNTEQFLGWEAAIHIAVVVREPEAAFGLAETVATHHDITMDGPHWQIDADNPAHDEARRRAVAAARMKAKSYADAAGVALGPLVELVEGGDRMQPRARMAMASAEADHLDPADQQVSASVTLVFNAE